MAVEHKEEVCEACGCLARVGTIIHEGDDVVVIPLKVMTEADARAVRRVTSTWPNRRVLDVLVSSELQTVETAWCCIPHCNLPAPLKDDFRDARTFCALICIPPPFSLLWRRFLLFFTHLSYFVLIGLQACGIFAIVTVSQDASLCQPTRIIHCKSIDK